MVRFFRFLFIETLLFQEKGNFVIHVAAHAGQLEQFELLASYGACLNVSDKNGNSADIIARYVC